MSWTALALKSGDVIATGGGLPCREGRMARLRELGTVIWLKGDLARRPRSARGGPAPARCSPDARPTEIEALYRQREPYYREAHVIVDTTGLTIDQVVSRILSILQGRVRDGPRRVAIGEVARAAWPPKSEPGRTVVVKIGRVFLDLLSPLSADIPFEEGLSRALQRLVRTTGASAARS